MKIGRSNRSHITVQLHFFLCDSFGQKKYFFRFAIFFASAVAKNGNPHNLVSSSSLGIADPMVSKKAKQQQPKKTNASIMTGF